MILYTKFVIKGGIRMFKNLEQILLKVINPVAQKLSANQSLAAISAGFVKMMPVTLGMVVFSIIGNLPISGFAEWLTKIGLKESMDAVLGASTNIMALYLSFSIAYSFTLKRQQSAITAGFLSMAGFILLMPQIIVLKEESVSALSMSYLGSSGTFVALVIALMVGHLYCFLCEKGLKISFPKSVPSMVSESLEPVIISIIICSLLVIIRIIFVFTPYGNIHDFISKIISTPLLAIGTSIPALLFMLFLGNVFWFFGIHPTTILGTLSPVVYMMAVDNITKFQTGEPMIYVTPLLVYMIAGIGGNGNTLGLIISMIGAKSQRYKSMFKLAIIPHIFNINEPLIFGMPVMLNPIFFIPMTFNCVVSGILAWVYLTYIPITYNPLMGFLPWTTPVFISYFLSGGLVLLGLVIILIIVNTLMYYPFFKIADKKALEEERLAKEEASHEQII